MVGSPILLSSQRPDLVLVADSQPRTAHAAKYLATKTEEEGEAFLQRQLTPRHTPPQLEGETHSPGTRNQGLEVALKLL